ncbi:hypothetical protein BROUX41_001300 [Berkeleyomyces rouxiae]|uniref:uncharacterized protein n=1 Tax=Berkeleyomyces rouxiae TaxID=2035830 RepID=UPI003B7A9E5F
MSVPSFETYRTRLLVRRKLSFLSPADQQRIDDMCRILDSVGAAASAAGYVSDADGSDAEDAAADSLSKTSSVYSVRCGALDDDDYSNDGPLTALSPPPPVGVQVRLAMYGPERRLRRESRRCGAQAPNDTFDDISTPRAAAAAAEPLLSADQLQDMQRALDHAFTDCGSSIAWPGSSGAGSPATTSAEASREVSPELRDCGGRALAEEHAALSLFYRLGGRYRGVRRAARKSGDFGEVRVVEGLMRRNAVKLQGLVARWSRGE